MYTATFYSYRGGVGRTTALVNVAVDLAIRGRSVLLVDFDLEAPSLSSFGILRPPGGAHAGLVEFIEAYLRSGKTPGISDYTYAIRDDLYPAGLIKENGGKIWVMPAGSGSDDYWSAFQRINWTDLYNLQDGFVLFEDLKFQWRESFKPDYVLIDARAGISDRLPICTRQLPDAIVTLVTQDSEEEEECDLTGVRRVLEEVARDCLRSSRRRIDVLPVITQVAYTDAATQGIYMPLEEPELVADPDDCLCIKFDLAATIPHTPELIAGKQLFANLRPRHPRSLAYRRLADALTRSNCAQDREGALRFLIELQRHPDAAVAVPAIDSDSLMGWFDWAKRLDEVLESFWDKDAEILTQAASSLFLAGRYDEAMSALDRAIELAPLKDIMRWQRVSGRPGAKLVTIPLVDSALWQRACYRRHLKLPNEVDDLFRLLDVPEQSLSKEFDGAGLKREFDARTGSRNLPEFESIALASIPHDKWPPTHCLPGIDPYVASAFHRLRELGKTQEALQKPRIQQLPEERRQVLLEDAAGVRPSTEQDPLLLIRARKWRAAIGVLEPRVAHSSSASYVDQFFLAIAFWALGNEVRATEICASAKQLLLEGSQVESILEECDADNIEQIPLLSLIFWKAGDSAAARQFLDRCDELVTQASEGDAFFSVWRFHLVNRDQFREDCHCQRQMIGGAGIRPYFLGQQASVV